MSSPNRKHFKKLEQRSLTNNSTIKVTGTTNQHLNSTSPLQSSITCFQQSQSWSIKCFEMMFNMCFCNHSWRFGKLKLVYKFKVCIIDKMIYSIEYTYLEKYIDMGFQTNTTNENNSFHMHMILSLNTPRPATCYHIQYFLFHYQNFGNFFKN
jgi:hypothetical protein